MRWGEVVVTGLTDITALCESEVAYLPHFTPLMRILFVVSIIAYSSCEDRRHWHEAATDVAAGNKANATNFSFLQQSEYTHQVKRLYSVKPAGTSSTVYMGFSDFEEGAYFSSYVQGSLFAML